MPEPRDEFPSVPMQPSEGPTLGALLSRSPLALPLLCVLTFVVSLLLLEVPGRWGETFWLSSKVWLLHFLCAFLPVLYVASLAAYFMGRKSHHWVGSCSSAERTAVVLFSVLGGALGVLPPIVVLVSLLQLEGTAVEFDAITQMPGFDVKFSILAFLGWASGLPHAVGLVRMHVHLIASLPESQSTGRGPKSQGFDEDVLRYQRLRSRLRQSLGLIAAIIGAAVLLAGALRNLINEAAPSQPELIPASSVMVYGLYFTALLASFYLPAHKSLTEMGEALANQLVLKSIGTRTTWKQWTEEHDAVRAYLGLRNSALSELRDGIALFAPLVASISSLLLAR